MLVGVHAKDQGWTRDDAKGLVNFIQTMYRKKYVIVHREPKNRYWWNPLSVRCVEYAFLKLDETFFKIGR